MRARSIVPIYRARLPRAIALVPYLDRIDANRWYSNHGELVSELEGRLAASTATSDALWVTAASGTAALEAAILASAGRATQARPLALLPAYTFVATAMAVERLGYVPHFLDVDERTWALDADAVAAHPFLPQAGVVVPVDPYGRANAQRDWRRFVCRTGVPVVIDGAASIESLIDGAKDAAGSIPVALSFHATKPYSTGEGGAVVWSDPIGLARVARALNFGFLGSRVSQASGTNGKMSEYHAAVGLASLDAFSAKRADVARIVRTYRDAARAHGLAERIVLSPHVSSSYALFAAIDLTEAERVVDALTEAGIEHRFWYGRGLHREPSLARYPADDLPVAERLAGTLVGIPFYEDLPASDIDRIVTSIAYALRPHCIRR